MTLSDRICCTMWRNLVGSRHKTRWTNTPAVCGWLARYNSLLMSYTLVKNVAMSICSSILKRSHLFNTIIVSAMVLVWNSDSRFFHATLGLFSSSTWTLSSNSIDNSMIDLAFSFLFLSLSYSAGVSGSVTVLPDDLAWSVMSSTRSQRSSFMRMLLMVDFQTLTLPSLLESMTSLETTVSNVPIAS